MISATKDGVTTTHTYGNSSWRDPLTAYDGQSIAYEGQTFNGSAVSGAPVSGNPVSYFNCTRCGHTYTSIEIVIPPQPPTDPPVIVSQGDNEKFINADCMAYTGQGFMGYNMFAYCGNNPVNRVDPSGRFWGIMVGFFTAIAALLSECSSDESESSNKTEDGTHPGNANCYAYAIKWSLDPRTGEPFTEKPQPGRFSSTGYDPQTNYAAALISSNVEDPVERMRSFITKKVSSDLEVLGMTFIKLDDLSHAPRNGNWLVALACNPDNGDYPWWRQNTDGT